MPSIRFFDSPLGKLLLTADQAALTGLVFGGESVACPLPTQNPVGAEAKVLDETARWLDLYFAGREPDFMPPLCASGSPFRMAVWQLLRAIPYGQTVTYASLAKQVAKQTGCARMSAQAIGGAVGHNPIAILIPCHRVVGANGCLTGYAGGLERKRRLLLLEGVDMTRLFMPQTNR